MKKMVFALFLILLFSGTINAIELCTPSDEYLKYMALSDEEKKEYIEPAYCKELIEKDSNDSFLVSFFKTLTNTISASSTDSSYNAVNDGLITTPQNQGNYGTCWAFSSISAVEANARKNNVGNYNFSESHMIYSVLSSAYSDSAGQNGKYYTTNFDGGKVTYAASYYFNNYGQLLDNEWTYGSTIPKITSSQYKQGRKMISLSNFSLANLGNYSSCTSSEISYIKKQIVNYGSVQASMYMDENLFKDTGKNYYIASTSDSSLPNHGISIVGWDDNVSRSKFSTNKDGAFIIKNSWGSNWSDDGYFYISYNDAFICKNTATFYGVSNKTFENTYAASDMVGAPTLMFNTTFYTSTKFQKTTSTESLGRVSFPVGESTSYYVYLVPDNNLNSTSSWRLLASGSSTEYGIRSVDLSGYTLTGNYFTIVVKYDISQSTSVFTMCNNATDTSSMNYSTNTNFLSSNGSTWIDMSSIPIGGSTIACEPNIYAYTDFVTTPSTNGTITINSITANSSSTSNNKFTVSITNDNVSTGSISYTITNSSSQNVTSHFTISPNYSTNKITVTSDGLVSGRFNFIINYGNKTTSSSFNIYESFSVRDSSLISISGTNLNVTITNNYTLTYQKLINALNIANSSVQILNASGNTVTSTSASVGTGYKLKLNNSTYLIVVLGDVNSDGKISALDYIEVRKHIMGTRITDSAKLLASDLDKNNNINALDYIAIRMILMR